MNADILRAMFAGIEKPYIDILVGKHGALLQAALQKVVADAGDVSKIAPPLPNIFRAFRACPWAKLKVLAIGQDPYPKAGDADGMAFSTSADKTPASLRNIYKCLETQKLIAKTPEHNSLDSWAAQGVLLLNASLTTTVGNSNAHQEIWDKYTDAVVRSLLEARPEIIMMLWGKDAQSKGSVVEHDRVLTWGHPSPLSSVNRSAANPLNFLHNDNFRKCNEMLVKANLAPIDWNSVNGPVAAEAPARPTVYLGTDGGSRGNGKADCRASWAFVIWKDGAQTYTESGLVDSTKDNPATNNRGELTAIQRGLAHIDKNIPGTDVVVISDSEYSLNTVSEWAPRWYSNPKKYELDKKKNLDIVKPCIDTIERLRSNRKIKFEHVNSHQEEPDKKDKSWLPWHLNDICDKLCQQVLDGPAAK